MPRPGPVYFEAGKTVLRGFTAVFALFIVPIIDLSGVDLDNYSLNVEQFVVSCFGAKVEAAMLC